MGSKKIAICFFGITRSLRFTIDSIEENVLSPARELGEVKVFSHLFNQREIHNARSEEFGPLDVDEHRLLCSDWLQLEEPDDCLELHDFSKLKEFGDIWDDKFLTLRNLIHQLHSLDQVTKQAISWNPDIYLFIRPDLQYHDSLQPYLHEALGSKGHSVFIPDWQHGYGYNDRFAICQSKSAASAYGNRMSNCLDYCKERKKPLHSESLLKYSLDKKDITPEGMQVTASRVRSNGTVRVENFSSRRKSKLQSGLVKILTWLRIRNFLRRILPHKVLGIRHRRM